MRLRKVYYSNCLNASMNEIFVSTDVETDGPIPGEYSMLSFGSAALKPDKEIIATFSANLYLLAGARQDESTMEWWKSQPLAWQAHRQDLQHPQDAMKRYLEWLKSLSGELVFVGYPVSFDFMFICWYLMKFAGKNPFSFYTLDIKTFAWSMLKVPFYSISKSMMPKQWFDKCDKTHIALDDAIEQGMLFCNMLKENEKK